MRIWLSLLLLCPSCVEYRWTRQGEERYIGWSNTPQGLDPKTGPRAKVFLTPGGSIRPYIGGEIIRQQELLLGLGVIYYVGEEKSYEIGVRDSVYKNNDLLERDDDMDRMVNPWTDYNPMIYLGGVFRF